MKRRVSSGNFGVRFFLPRLVTDRALRGRNLSAGPGSRPKRGRTVGFAFCFYAPLLGATPGEKSQGVWGTGPPEIGFPRAMHFAGPDERSSTRSSDRRAQPSIREGPLRAMAHRLLAVADRLTKGNTKNAAIHPSAGCSHETPHSGSYGVVLQVTPFRQNFLR